MKQLFLFIALLICTAASAQTIKKDAKGNYYYVAKGKDTTTGGTPTGNTFTDKNGKVYPILVSKNGKLFYRRTAATSGIVYNSYLPK